MTKRLYETMKVRCTSRFVGEVTGVEIGKVYEIYSVHTVAGVSIVSLFGMPGSAYPAAWFEPVADEEEERLWKAFRPALDPGHCVCGIYREKCWIHRIGT